MSCLIADKLQNRMAAAQVPLALRDVERQRRRVRQLRVRVAENHVGAQRQQIAHRQMQPVEPRDLYEVAKAACEPPAIRIAEQPAAVLSDRADFSARVEVTVLTSLPFGVGCDGIGHLAQRLTTCRATEIKDGQTIRRRAGLQQALLQRLAQRMGLPTSSAQIAQSVKDLAVVRGQDQDFRIVPPRTDRSRR